MTPADLRLAALLREDSPPARDPAFRLAVLERQARRSFQARMAAVFAAGLAMTALLAVVGPSLTGAASAPVLSGAFALALTAWGLMQIRRPI